MFLFREGLRDVPQMAGMFKGVTDRDFVDIGAYFARQTPPRGTSRPDPEAARARRGAREGMGCGSCHLAGLPRPEACAARSPISARTISSRR